MFGHRFFGARYFGPRYWGDGGDVVVIPPDEVPTGQGSWNLTGIAGRRKYTAIVNGRRYVGTADQLERLVEPVVAKTKKSDLPTIEVTALQDTDGPALREAAIVSAQIRSMFDALHNAAELDALKAAELAALKAEADEMQMIVAVLLLI